MNNGLGRIKAILFDAGGTLLHLDSSRICDLLRNELGIEADPASFPRAQALGWVRINELMAMGGQSTETLRREYYSTLLPEVGVAADAFVPALELLVELAEAEMLWRVAGRGAATALDQLRGRGITVGVVSNSDGRVAWGCERAGLAGHLDFIIDSHYVGVEKPDPRIFSLGLERAAVAAEDAAYVGDLYSVDVLGSRQAGLTAVLYDPFDLNPGADCVRIRHLIDLLELVDHH